MTASVSDPGSLLNGCQGRGRRVHREKTRMLFAGSTSAAE
jgi:hypothetical protein